MAAHKTRRKCPENFGHPDLSSLEKASAVETPLYLKNFPRSTANDFGMYFIIYITTKFSYDA